MSGNLTELAEKLIEFSNVATESEVYSKLIKAVNTKLHKAGTENGKKVVQQIQYEVEKH